MLVLRVVLLESFNLLVFALVGLSRDHLLLLLFGFQLGNWGGGGVGVAQIGKIR
ncbi:hypothetical protein MGG_16304 [Pyricularia oryzae 70-15]|uniref:Uncharacterized protein n=1 Tax=Pyricularia oryzae (strain 70-15 / ATCC MYA-4617 / FGSC 8958) TaxID=242507 RepID=G4MRN9_PYRO7|nr:uncharacterized protein MGG_16304 [Pyricularia oryzae 70-15]EHA57462.1 hypothetical protein MGG_16304 [Pyricularia oryzae 70-15]